MKRFHVHLQVTNLEDSIRFYSEMFGIAPSKVKPAYAKWMVEEPRLNFAISTGARAKPGLSHLGFQVDDEAELEAASGNAARAANVVVHERDVVCCYARSDKAWAEDPQGIKWETFLTHGDHTSYGFSADETQSPIAAPAKTAEVDCCIPKSATTAGCCG